MTIGVLDRASGIGSHDFTRPMTPERADPAMYRAEYLRITVAHRTICQAAKLLLPT